MSSSVQNNPSIPPATAGPAEASRKPDGLQNPVLLIVVIVVVAVVVIGAVAAYFLFRQLVDEIDDLDSFEFTAPIEHDLPAEAYDSLDVSNINGYVKIVGVAGADTIEIDGLKKAHSIADLDDIDLQISDVDGTLVLVVVHEFDLTLGEKLDLDIIIPSDIVVLDAESTNGDVEISGVQSVLRVGSTNGRVDIEVITVDNDISVFTTNGAIHVRLLPTLNATLDMTTTNGDISLNDVDLNISLDLPNHVSGDLGSGGYDISIVTTNGDIDLHVLD